ncbi:MAG: hypothetical protein ACE5HI_10825 [bacterium]
MIAQLLHDNKVVSETPLNFAGEESTFAGSLKLDVEGEVDLIVLAMDASNANFGMVQQNLLVK